MSNGKVGRKKKTGILGDEDDVNRIQDAGEILLKVILLAFQSKVIVLNRNFILIYHCAAAYSFLDFIFIRQI